ncbi:carbon storage regulator [Botrimarina mediterranea]|uniref:Translational regulator CsrA n=1 Tax=Botrimarina mediterranea TaxID=2528022 RepID=A0A518K6R4_9BACT|nr:carbon storage regulator [Botrimarina mediterranea]QDV73474.1 Carbon storage regulator [Botrimarina mediterranea]QDV77991.1 Carbon storage regulator [Planctomycetes bacterium K2D]
MLVLTRKPQEKIRIGDGITITVIKTKGSGVRLGIEAPADVPVLRGELLAARDSFVKTETDEASVPDAATNQAKSDSEVQFTRVKRSRVPSVLPNLLGEPGPLRAMMAGRATTGA